MKKYLLIYLMLISFVSLAQDFVKGELIVQLNGNHRNFELELSQSDLKNERILIGNQISRNLNLWLIHFDKNLNHKALSSRLMDLKSVQIAQVNHFVTQRETIPNDPNFASQWHHNNTGQTGGTVGADISTPEAWDITTGGLSAFGDTVVACIIEGNGGDLAHPDLAQNAWKNHLEIPNNGIDDDNNGYIDDYLGWNIQADNDDIGNGSHGTRVAGMIGAVGNNNIGVSGVNWKVKLMMVRGQSASNEASVLEAYDYPLTMRKLYNQTNGQQGAFVVVTNASWGVDGGDPNNFPLWNNMYDSLGKYGIINIGATTNDNVDVEIAGDMPTGSPSDYLIGVTATNNNDIRTTAGYGNISVDIGAPGTSVYLPNSNDTYGNTTGTSFASPCVAGAVALLYSCPCPSFMSLVKNNPQAAADSIRKYILEGVDPIASLSTETVTGGRLNVFNSVQMLMNSCDASACISPFNLLTENLLDTSTTLTWGGFSEDYIVNYRLQGTPTWISNDVDTNFIDISNLQACSDYEFQVFAVCGLDTSLVSPISNFKTDGCCENPNFELIESGKNEIELTWNSILASNAYDIRYKDTLTSTWNELNDVSFPYSFQNLDSCTTYEFEIRIHCDGGSILDYENRFIVTTKGCGSCLDSTYCNPTTGNTLFEYLNLVEVGTIQNESGNNNGRAIFDDVTTTFQAGQKYEITLEPEYAGFNFTQNFRVFIDLDQDGEFNQGDELMLTKSNNGPITDTIEIPENITIGLTKMRVIMMSGNNSTNPCFGSNYYGESEDYCVNLSNTLQVNSNESIDYQIYPNPNSGSFFINTNTQIKQVELVSLDGKVIKRWNGNTNEFNISQSITGVYLLNISFENAVSKVEKIIIH